MSRSLVLPVLLGLGLSLLLATASCDVCSEGKAGCDEGSVAGAAGDAGSSAAVTCPQLEAFTNCLDAFCASASNPFCTCYNNDKQDLSAACKCVPNTLDPADYCKAAAANGIDAASFDCAAATAGVKTMCIGV